MLEIYFKILIAYFIYYLLAFLLFKFGMVANSTCDKLTTHT